MGANEGGSVPPPGWGEFAGSAGGYVPEPAGPGGYSPGPTPALVPAGTVALPPVLPVAEAQPPAEAAVRWRMGAAVIDNLLVYVGYLLICAILHWRVAAVGHLLVLLVLNVVYHFILESRDGQTVGKRRYGVKVVALDGSPASQKAIAVRSVLRVIDSLPVWYLSGLINMVRTGPERRQRIGDVAGETKVIAVDGRAAAKGTPNWYLPAATLSALTISVLGVYAVVQAQNQPLTAGQSAQFVAGCERSSGGIVVDCQCVLTHLEADGYDSLASLSTLDQQARSEAFAGQPNAARRELQSVALACRR